MRHLLELAEGRISELLEDIGEKEERIESLRDALERYQEQSDRHWRQIVALSEHIDRVCHCGMMHTGTIERHDMLGRELCRACYGWKGANSGHTYTISSSGIWGESVDLSVKVEKKSGDDDPSPG